MVALFQILFSDQNRKNEFTKSMATHHTPEALLTHSSNDTTPHPHNMAAAIRATVIDRWNEILLGEAASEKRRGSSCVQPAGKEEYRSCSQDVGWLS